MIAAEQKARVTYDNILRLSDDTDVNDVIKFLRAREVLHRNIENFCGAETEAPVIIRISEYYDGFVP